LRWEIFFISKKEDALPSISRSLVEMQETIKVWMRETRGIERHKISQ